VQDWKSEAQVAASDCAVDAHPWRQDSRSDAVPHPIKHVFASAVTLRAHVPRFSPQVPRQAAVEEGEGGLHAWTQLASSFRQLVCEERNESVQLRIQEPTSAGAEFVRQSIRQLDRVMRAALRQATFSAPQPAARRGGRRPTIWRTFEALAPAGA
jgi:hypothetical protein